MGKPVPFEVHEKYVRVFRYELTFFVANLRDGRIDSLLVDEFRRFLAQGDDLILYRALRHHACSKDNARHHDQSNHGYLPHHLPLSVSTSSRVSLHLFPCMHRNPYVPNDHFLLIGRPMKGFFHARAQTANHFPVRWKKNIESGIAPPQLPG